MRTPQPFPLKIAERTLRRQRTDVEARGEVRTLHRGTSAVFYVAGVESPNEEARERLFLLYAQHLERLSQTLEQDHNPARAFEHILAQLNQDLARIGPTLDIRKERAHLFFGLCAKNQLFLSGFGSLLALYLHKTAERRFSVYELHQQLDQGNGTWEKTCNSILDGELHPGDVCYLATPLPEILLPSAGLQDILTTLPAKGALERIEGFVPPAMAFSGLVFQVEEHHRPHLSPLNTLGSLDVLQKTQERTADILGERSPHQSLRHEQSWLGRTDTKALVLRAGQGARLVGGHIGGTFLRVFQTAFSLLHHPKLHAALKKYHKRISSSPILVIIPILFLFLGIGGWHVTQERAVYQHQKEQEIALLNQGREALIQAESNLIYNNKRGATETLLKAKELLQNTTTPLQENSEAFAKTLQDIEKLLEKSEGIIRVTEKRNVPLPDSQEAMSGALLPTPYVVTKSGETFRFDALSGSWMQEETLLSQKPLIITEESPTTFLTLTSGKELLRYDTVTHTEATLVSGVKNQSAVSILKTYNSVLYLLNPNDQQIIKLRQQGSGYEAGTPWIHARSSDISKASSMAIDGSIYLGTPDGIRVFFGGKEQLWSSATLTQPLSTITDLFTTPDQDDLYVLDSEHHRVLVFAKSTGALVAHYLYNENLTGLRVFFSEETKSVTLLTTKGYLEFTAEHTL